MRMCCVACMHATVSQICLCMPTHHAKHSTASFCQHLQQTGNGSAPCLSYLKRIYAAVDRFPDLPDGPSTANAPFAVPQTPLDSSCFLSPALQLREYLRSSQHKDMLIMRPTNLYDRSTIDQARSSLLANVVVLFAQCVHQFNKMTHIHECM